MSLFSIVMLGLGAGFFAALLLLGLMHPRSGAQTLEWRPMRSAELEIQNDIDDLDQMLEAANARRRRRGAPELTEESVRASLTAEQIADSQSREARLADLEIEQMLAVKNRRREAKGLPAITAAEYRAGIEGDRR